MIESNDAVDSLKARLVGELAEDHVGLWEVVRGVQQAIGSADETAVRRMTLDVVRSLLETGQARAGFPTPDGRGFAPWPLSPVETLARIEREWSALGRAPDIGEIVWLS